MFIIKPKSQVIAERNLAQRIDLFLRYLSLDLDIDVSYQEEQICIIGKMEAREAFIERLKQYDPPMMEAFYSYHEIGEGSFTYVNATFIAD
jgi:hypothetical protein